MHERQDPLRLAIALSSPIFGPDVPYSPDRGSTRLAPASRRPRAKEDLMKSQSIRLTAAALLLLAAQAPALAAGSKTIRPDVGKPLPEAQKALQAKSYAEARTKPAKRRVGQ